MAIEVVPSNERLEELQDLLDDLIDTQAEEYRKFNDDHQKAVQELNYTHKSQRTELFRNNPELSFAVAAGFVKRKRF